jgi:hypothetical protein
MRRSRRAFVGGLAAATAIGLPALVSCAAAGTKVSTKPRLRLIGWLGVRDPGYIFLHQTLPELGWVEGRDFLIEVRHADGLRERLPALAAELLTLPVDVLVTSTIEPTRVAMQATAVTPIVFTGFGGDPVKEGFIASLSRPGGNVTGVGTGIAKIAVLAQDRCARPGEYARCRSRRGPSPGNRGRTCTPELCGRGRKCLRPCRAGKC